MNEQQWMTSGDLKAMLALLRVNSTPSDRKMRLFAVACCRRIFHLLPDQDCRDAVQAAEAFAEGKARIELLREVEAAGELYCDHREDVLQERLGYFAGGAIFQLGQERLACDILAAATCDAVACSTLDSGDDPRTADAARHGEMAAQCSLLRDLFGNSFRPLPPLSLSLLTANGGRLTQLARAAYEDRILPEGRLDNARLAVLADALEEAGFEDAEMLSHLRQPDAVHVRGCFALDWILGRS